MTIRELIELTAEAPNDFELLWADFLDHFYSSNTEDKKRLVKNEPKRFKEVPIQTYAFIAGAVEKLCNEYSIKPPKWVFNNEYFLEEPMFSLNAQGDLRTILLVESPNEFVVRNVFVSENCLDRV